MRNFSFYNTASRDFLKDTANLVEKLVGYQNGVIILCPDESTSLILDDYLWSFKAESFVPHTLVNKNSEVSEALVISYKQLDFLNHKTLLVFKGTPIEINYCEKYEKIYYFFDEGKDDEVKMARTFWKDALKSNGKCKYWKVEQNKWVLAHSE